MFPTSRIHTPSSFTPPFTTITSAEQKAKGECFSPPQAFARTLRCATARRHLPTIEWLFNSGCIFTRTIICSLCFDCAPIRGARLSACTQSAKTGGGGRSQCRVLADSVGWTHLGATTQRILSFGISALNGG